MTAWVLEKVLDGGAGSQYRSPAAVHALAATALSTVGTDFRRWWGLAFMGLLSTVVLLEPPAVGETVAMTTVTGAVALAVAGVAAWDLKVHPWGRLRVDRALPATI